MDSMREGVLCICCAAIGLTLAQGAIPAERFQKQIRLLMTVLMLTAVVSALRGADFSAVEQDPTESEISTDIAARAKQMQEEAVAGQIRISVNRAFAAHQVNCTLTALYLHISDDGSIVIDRAVLSGNRLTGTVYLRELLGPDVIIEEADEDADSGEAA